MDISTILVSYNTSSLLHEAVTKLQDSSRNLKTEIIFVDNASVDDSVHKIQTLFPESRLIVNKLNVGFGRANNQALPFATGRYILLLNTDAFVAPDTLDKCVAYMDSHPECGILGVRLEGRDGVLQPCARYFPTPWNVFLQRSGLRRWVKNVQMVDDMGWAHDEVRACDWVVGCFYLVRREVIDQVGLFDPRYFLYFEEVDHCRTAKKAGWEVVFYPHTTVIHLGGESAKSEGKITKSGKQLDALGIESELLYFRKHYGFFGLLVDIILIYLAELINTFKRFAKAGVPIDISTSLRRVKLVFSIAVKTRLGTKPTR
jgi:hypothetical protein